MIIKMKLDNNIVCIVTGGVSGLGLAAAKALLLRGCRVVLADFNEVHIMQKNIRKREYK